MKAGADAPRRVEQAPVVYSPQDGPLAQAVEHLPFKQRVAGSSPARLTIDSLGVEVLKAPGRSGALSVVRVMREIVGHRVTHEERAWPLLQEHTELSLSAFQSDLEVLEEANMAEQWKRERIHGGREDHLGRPRVLRGDEM